MRMRDTAGGRVRGSLYGALGPLLMTVGPAALWSVRSDITLWGGVIAFALGWVLVGAGLGSRSGVPGGARRGALIAAAAYPVVGVLLTSVVVGNLLDQHGPAGLPFVALTWPLRVAIAAHLFGLGIR